MIQTMVVVFTRISHSLIITASGKPMVAIAIGVAPQPGSVDNDQQP